MRIVVVVDAFGPALPSAEAATAITAGWRAAAPDDRLTVLTSAPSPTELAAALDQADLAVVGGPRFDWSTLRDSVVTAVGSAALERGLPCVVLAAAVSVGRREAAAVGVDAAYAVDPPTDDTGSPGSAAALTALAERVARRWSVRSSSSGA